MATAAFSNDSGPVNPYLLLTCSPILLVEIAVVESGILHFDDALATGGSHPISCIRPTGAASTVYSFIPC